MKKMLFILMILSLLLTACDEREKNDDLMEGFVLLQGGSFTMGSIDNESDEQPVHQVTLSPYAISRYEVSQIEWYNVMNNNPSQFVGNTIMPVEQVSWYQAIVYCNKRSLKRGLELCYKKGGQSDPNDWGAIPETDYDSEWDAITCDWTANGYRLPTEAEWEFAARGANLSTGKIYSGSNILNEVGWYNLNSSNATQAKGSKTPNELMLYDMSGNVWEWCWDMYGLYSSDSQIDPHGNTANLDRVIRGGGWNSEQYNCRNAKRNFVSPGYSGSTVGFRLVRTYIHNSDK